MLDQYPHIIQFKLLDQPTPSLVDGVWEFGETEESPEMECRAESNTNGGTVSSQSGEHMPYSYTVYMPKNQVAAQFGTQVKLQIGTQSYDLTIKWVSHGQLNTRVYL